MSCAYYNAFMVFFAYLLYLCSFYAAYGAHIFEGLWAIKMSRWEKGMPISLWLPLVDFLSGLWSFDYSSLRNSLKPILIYVVPVVPWQQLSQSSGSTCNLNEILLISCVFLVRHSLVQHKTAVSAAFNACSVVAIRISFPRKPAYRMYSSSMISLLVYYNLIVGGSRDAHCQLFHLPWKHITAALVM